METEKLETGLFEITDTVTVADTFDGNEYFKGAVGQIVKFEPEKCTDYDPKRCIWVNLPNVKDYLFRAHSDYNVPLSKKKWVCFSANELRLGQKPKTQKEIIDELVEKSQAFHAYILHEPLDHTCLVEGCNNFAEGYGVYNSNGTGYVFKACKWHLKEYGGRWCDGSPFKGKEENVISPLWLEKVEEVKK